MKHYYTVKADNSETSKTRKPKGKWCGELRTGFGKNSERVGDIIKTASDEYTIWGWDGFVAKYGPKDFKRIGTLNLGYASVPEFMLFSEWKASKR